MLVLGRAEVEGAGFVPGVYVGAGAILTGSELFWRLTTKHYWKSGSRVPDIPHRGYQLIQTIIRNDKIVYEWYANGHGVDKKHGAASLSKATVAGLSLALLVVTLTAGTYCRRFGPLGFNGGVLNSGVGNVGILNNGIANGGVLNGGSGNVGIGNQGSFNQGLLNAGTGNQGILNRGGGSLAGLAPGGHLLGLGK